SDHQARAKDSLRLSGEDHPAQPFVKTTWYEALLLSVTFSPGTAATWTLTVLTAPVVGFGVIGMLTVWMLPAAILGIVWSMLTAAPFFMETVTSTLVSSDCP